MYGLPEMEEAAKESGLWIEGQGHRLPGGGLKIHDDRLRVSYSSVILDGATKCAPRIAVAGRALSGQDHRCGSDAMVAVVAQDRKDLRERGCICKHVMASLGRCGWV